MDVNLQQRNKKTMETIYYTREANAVLNTLIESGNEVELKMLLEKAKVNFQIAPTVLSGLLQGQEIVYRMEEISAQFHFPNTSSFCRFFTRHTGVTPQEFQKNSLIIK